MSKTVFLQKNDNNFETLRQIFLSLQQISLRALLLYICKIKVNRDRRTCRTNSWSNLMFNYSLLRMPKIIEIGSIDRSCRENAIQKHNQRAYK